MTICGVYGIEKIAVHPDDKPHTSHFIEITGVKTEKVQDISDRDCLLEGIVPVDTQNLLTLDGNMPFEGFSLDGKSWIGDTPQEVFAAISNKVIKKDVWVNNKMVDVYEFKLVK